MKQCTTTCATPAAFAARMRACRCPFDEWTPPSETSPMRCSAAPGSRAAANASPSTGFAASEPSAQARLMRVSSWYTTRPAPMLRCPTSELPIWPSGRPTASPEASSRVCGHVANRRSRFGVLAREMALPGPGSARPYPSMMTRQAGSASPPSVAWDSSTALTSCSPLGMTGGAACSAPRLDRQAGLLASPLARLDGGGITGRPRSAGRTTRP